MPWYAPQRLAGLAGNADAGRNVDRRRPERRGRDWRSGRRHELDRSGSGTTEVATIIVPQHVHLAIRKQPQPTRMEHELKDLHVMSIDGERSGRTVALCRACSRRTDPILQQVCVGRRLSVCAADQRAQKDKRSSDQTHNRTPCQRDGEACSAVPQDIIAYPPPNPQRRAALGMS